MEDASFVQTAMGKLSENTEPQGEEDKTKTGQTRPRVYQVGIGTMVRGAKEKREGKIRTGRTRPPVCPAKKGTRARVSTKPMAKGSITKIGRTQHQVYPAKTEINKESTKKTGRIRLRVFPARRETRASASIKVTERGSTRRTGGIQLPACRAKIRIDVNTAGTETRKIKEIQQAAYPAKTEMMEKGKIITEMIEEIMIEGTTNKTSRGNRNKKLITGNSDPNKEIKTEIGLVGTKIETVSRIKIMMMRKESRPIDNEGVTGSCRLRS